MINWVLAIANLVAVFFVLWLFIALSLEHRRVQRERIALYDALLLEHKYWHKCSGGLGIDPEGKISHFKIGEAEGYDYD